MSLDEYWMMIILNFIFLAVIAAVSSWVADFWGIFVAVIFSILIIHSYLNFYNHFMLNDYELLQNIETVNTRIKASNSRMDGLKKDMDEVKQKLLSGQATEIGQEAMSMA